MPPTLRTPRLLLSPLEDRDLVALHTHWNDPQVARFLWDASPVPFQTVADAIARSSRTFQASGWGLWSLRPAAEEPGLIGVCGLSPFEHGNGVELLYSLTPSHWSQGLATEAATAVLAYAFEPSPSPRSWPPPTTPTPPPSASSPASEAPRPPGSSPAPTPTPASPFAPGMLLPGPCSSTDRATDF